MAIVPQPRPAQHTRPEAEPVRRWPTRVYPGSLTQASGVRSDLLADLYRLPCLNPELAEAMVLCASEMFANAVDHSRSGTEPEGLVIRTLAAPTRERVRVEIIDDGHRPDRSQVPAIPRERSAQEWEEAKCGRGLLLIDHLAASWGTRQVVDFPFCEGLGTVIWAEFTLAFAQDGWNR
ncbi:ATP-binding protein [Nocardiopsis ganjiahuensis]|uniref:ATP-binding protein n=1 Tax=Nocardiopsis ganjiahuensis TaxID=239984 RepID=UPI000476BD2B|nr:ATP-binding protein [Nocardiopsis ganjiahuensis]